MYSARTAHLMRQAGVAAALAIMLLVLPSNPAVATGATIVNGRISFITNIDAYERIGTIRLDGSDESIASLKNGYDEFFASNTPKWSADGERVLFLTNTGGNTSHVRTMRADATGLQDHGTIPSDSSITWTPEGGVGWIDTNGLWEAPLDALGTATLVAPGFQGYGLDYSPDGSKVAYALYSSGDGSYHIWTADRNGANPVQITTGSPGQFDPVWAPDGNTIVYRFGEFGGGAIQLHAIAPNGTGDVPLTSDGKNFGATWSPDGTKLAFNSSRSRGVWVMNADGSNQHREAAGTFGMLDWQPAHATIAASRSLVTFGDTATLIAGTPGGQTSGTLSIFRVRAGTDALLKIDQGAPNPNGIRHLTLRPNASATYLVFWSGDGVDPGGWGDVASIRVQVRLSASTPGGYATKDGVRLYHYTTACTDSGDGCPKVSFTLAPPHPGEKLIVVFYVHTNGSWHLADHRAWKLRDGKVVRLYWRYGGTSFIGRTYRAMASFHGDTDHKGNHSKWVSFRVTD